MSSLIHDPLAICLLIALTLVLPALGVWDYRRLLRRLRDGQKNARLEAYLWTIGQQWLLTLGFLGWWVLAGGGPAALRLVPAAAGWQWLVIAAGAAALVLVVLQAAAVLRSPEKLDQVREQAGDMAGIAPLTTTERRVFAGVCITAGICEEILYRGLLIAILTDVAGLWAAVALSTVIFGLGHAYQGAASIVKTGAAGLVMALLAVGSGSLFVPMVLHAAVDLTSGRMLSKAMRDPGPDCRVAGRDELQVAE